MKDIHAEITQAIIGQLEQGVSPWSKRWSAANIARPLRSVGIPYQGINVLILWASAAKNELTCSHWMTYKQAADLGGQVKKGSKGTGIVYASSFTKKDEDENERTISFLRGYTVFNACQVEGLPEEFYQQPREIPAGERNAKCDEFFAATGVKIRHGGDRAFYSPSEDSITMPEPGAFESMDAYYATLAHEFVHWTGKRDNRVQSGKGTEGYAFEELIAEIGAAFVCADLGLTPAVRDDHAPYIASWLKALKNDKRMIFKAASAAQRAADILFSGCVAEAVEELELVEA